MAASGGEPPCSRVRSTVAMSSPVDVNVTVVPVLAVKASSTFLNLACSSPLHTAATSIDPPIFWRAVVSVPPPVDDSLELPQAAASRSAADATSANVLLFVITVLLGRWLTHSL